MLTKMVIFSQDHFNKRKESQDLYEFISVLKDEFADDVRDIPFLKNDLFYINFFSIVRDMSILD
jgi:hypothetical protein